MRKEYEDFLVQRYEKTGVCDDAVQLVAIFSRYGVGHVLARRALAAFEEYVSQMAYRDVYDNLKVADNHALVARYSDRDSIEYRVYTHAAHLFRKNFEKRTARKA